METSAFVKELVQTRSAAFVPHVAGVAYKKDLKRPQIWHLLLAKMPSNLAWRSRVPLARLKLCLDTSPTWLRLLTATYL